MSFSGCITRARSLSDLTNLNSTGKHSLSGFLAGSPRTDLSVLKDKLLNFFDESTTEAESLEVAKGFAFIKELLSAEYFDSNVVVKKMGELEQMRPFKDSKIPISNIFAWILEGEALVTKKLEAADFELETVEPSLFLKRGISFLLANEPFENGWLVYLVPPKQHHDATDCIYRACLELDVVTEEQKNLFASIYTRLREIPKDQCTLKQSEKLNIALFGSFSLAVGSGCRFEGYFKKQTYGVSRSLQLDKSGMYIRLQNPDDLWMHSQNKKVTQCLYVSFDPTQPLEFGVQLLNKKMITKEQALCNKVAFSNEVSLHKKFYLQEHSSSGIWPIWHQCVYQKKDVEKLSVMAPLGEKLGEFFKGNDISFIDLTEVARQLCMGLFKLHSANYIHGSIKASHVLCKRVEDNRIEAGFIDFRKSREGDSGEDMLAFAKMLKSFVFRENEQEQSDSLSNSFDRLVIEESAERETKKLLQKLVRSLLESPAHTRPTSVDVLNQIIQIQENIGD